MSSQSPSINQETESFLAEDEVEQLSWQGILKESEDEEYPAQFVATNSRLIFSLGGGHFKDIGLNHVESVEVAANEEYETKGTDPDDIIALGVVSAVIGAISMFAGGFSGLATLAGLCFIGLGGYGIWHAKGNYQQLKDEVEVVEYTSHHILLRTSAESPFAKPIYIETKENVGPKLSKLVQENQ